MEGWTEKWTDINSVADPYHFDTDPDPGSKKCITGTNPDSNPDRTLIKIRIQTKKDLVLGKYLIKMLISLALCVYKIIIPVLN